MERSWSEEKVSRRSTPRWVTWQGRPGRAVYSGCDVAYAQEVGGRVPKSQKNRAVQADPVLDPVLTDPVLTLTLF